MQVMDCAAEIATFTEGSAPYFDRVLLKPLDRVEQLLGRSPAPVVALKPICETHRVHELLDRFPGSRAVWIFRHYRAAVDSASTKWKSGREAVRRLASGELEEAGWRAGGLTGEKLALVKRLYRADMSLHDANAVMWLLRNGLFFDLRADARPEILLVRYEDLVGDPRRSFARLFDFIGVPMPAESVEVIKRPSREDKTVPVISAEIASHCDALHERLLSHYNDSIRSTPSSTPATGALTR